MKPVKYKVWVHIEGLNKEGDCIEGDDWYEPIEAGTFKSPGAAQACQHALVALGRDSYSEEV